MASISDLSEEKTRIERAIGEGWMVEEIAGKLGLHKPSVYRGPKKWGDECYVERLDSQGVPIKLTLMGRLLVQTRSEHPGRVSVDNR